MTAPSGFKARSVARTNVYALLEEFKAAHEGDLRQVHRKRPAAFGALPAAFVMRVREPRIEHTGYGLRQRDVEVQIALVDLITDNADVAGRLDALADDLVDWLSARPHLLDDDASETSPRGTDEAELELGGVFYAATIVTLLARVEEPKL